MLLPDAGSGIPGKPMKRIYLILRCIFIWLISWAHFVVAVPTLIVVALFIDPRKSDPFQRFFARNIVRLTGVDLVVKRSPGFDPTRTSIFIGNHVNLFDPFILYSSIPQYFRGWELESHFRIPFYGWLMKRFGNIPVADQRTPGSMRRLVLQTREALASGVSLIVFPEGRRTLDGRVGPFQNGIFRLLRDLEVPIVPISVVGSFEFNRKNSLMLNPATITVHLHETIDTANLSETERAALASRVYGIVSRPINEHYER
ncbi:MAG: 1-acyl-sn-glycerol-3-phosphate acyltransferase [Acidobacteria bacterium]|nr:1-acyl-sn-glycerol-3-phosphate acyltransferase [Acidobacteriota bacterium]